MSSYDAVKKVLEDQSLDFDQLLREHTKHASNLARGCWMSRSGKECRDCLFDILDLIETVTNEHISLAGLLQSFHESLFRFRTVLLNHQVSGRSLVGLLTKSFKHVFA